MAGGEALFFEIRETAVEDLDQSLTDGKAQPG
jgi:hypothetical protein